MFATDIKLMLRLYSQPAAAMSEILDHGSLLAPSAAVLIVAWALGRSIPVLSFWAPILVLAVFYAPGLLIIGSLAGSLVGRATGGAPLSFPRDYAPMLTCVTAAWTAAYLPLVAIAWMEAALLPAAAGVATVYFLVLVFFAARTVFGTGNAAAVLVVSLSWIPLVAAYFLWGPLQYLLSWLASPFLLFYLVFYLRNVWGDLGSGLRRRQSYLRNLEAAAINPHDGEAQYQLGLIFQQRRQFNEAIERFQKAIAIDSAQTDAHYQLGRIAREQGRLKDALGHFQTVIDQDERHCQSEILRELGLLYLAAKQYEDARQELAKFGERRTYDAEGLLYLGQALEGLGKLSEAREAYQRAVQAVDIAPAYVRRIAARWGRLARRNLRRLSGKG